MIDLNPDALLKNTKTIVKFMGLETYEHEDQVIYKDKQPDLWKLNIAGRDIVASEFHSSWDWLLPVYKKLGSELKALSDKVRLSRKQFSNKASFLKTINDIDCIIRCEIWGVRIGDAYHGIVEAILFYEMYKDLDPKIVNERF